MEKSVPDQQSITITSTTKSSFPPYLPSSFFLGRMELPGQCNPSAHSLSALGRKAVISRSTVWKLS